MSILQTKENSKDWPHVKEQKKQVGKAQFQKHNKNSGSILPTVKPVDEDLYKIPSELLDTSKRVGPPLDLSLFYYFIFRTPFYLLLILKESNLLLVIAFL